MEKLLRLRREIRLSCTDKHAMQKGLLESAVYFILSFVLAIGGRIYTFSPFGVSVVSAASGSGMIFSALGASLAYILTQSSLNSLRYISSIMACTIISGALRNIGTTVNKAVLAPASTFLCLLVTGMALAFSGEITAAVIIRYTCEAAAGAMASYFIHRVYEMKIIKKGLSAVSSHELSAVVIVMALVIYSASDVSLFGLYPARIVAAFIVIMFAAYTHEAGGAIVGLCAGAALGINGGDLSVFAGFSLGGLLSGAFSQLGRVGVCAAFIAVNSLAALVALDYRTALLNSLQILLACAVFLLIPRSQAKKISNALKPTSALSLLDSVKNSLLWRLNNASCLTSEAAQSLISANSVERPQTDLGNESLYNAVRAEVCDNCGLADSCYGDEKENTAVAFSNIVELLRRGETPNFANIAPGFSSMCIRTSQLCSSFTCQYRERSAKIKSDVMLNEIISSYHSQLQGVSELLSSLACELNEKTAFDVGAAARVKSAVEALGIKVADVCCPVDRYDRTSAQLSVEKPENSFNRGELRGAVQAALGKPVDSPTIGTMGEYLHLEFKESPPFRVITGSSQFSAKSEKVCGDAFTSFTAENGCSYCILCDGMGTGQDAAVGAVLVCSMCEKLIKAGFGISSAIECANNALLMRSRGEQSVTLDIAEIDMYSGQAVFYKAGAGSTVIRKRGRTTELQQPSLPLGILRECKITAVRGTLGVGDIILMMTDGVNESKRTEARERLTTFKSGEMSSFAKEIASDAKKSYNDNRDDDITVVAAAIICG